MPHTTNAYPFESKVSQFAGELSHRFTTGSTLRSFLLVFDRDGNVLSLTFEDDSPEWHQKPALLASTGLAHLFYDPVDDGMEYIWLSWQGIEQSVMERLIGQRFEESDFAPIPFCAARARKLAKEREFPQSWGVMF